MAKKMLIDATHAEETRVVVVDGTKVEEFDFETINKRQISGNIYLAKVTRVEPSLQAAFVDYGGNRHGFLAFAEIHPDYYQIPAADREALIAEEQAYAEAQEAEENNRGRRRKSRKAEKVASEDEKITSDDGAEDSNEDNSDHDAFDVSEDRADDTSENSDAGGKDDDIESVAEEDVTEEIRTPRKSRPRRYKIQEVIKVRQIMLVQVVKEERGNKGAALTTYLSLPGRYCVLMPNTARGGGISRKITNVADRKKLKEIAGELDVPKGAGLIIRTAGSQRTRTEIRRDYEYLLRLWGQIRDVTFKSVAPASIYEEGDLIKRSIRDIYGKDVDEVQVEGARGYRVAKDFMKMIMPSHAKNVRHYNDSMPLFARYQVESYLAGMFNPVVQLKSGGYLVIGVTEALVAVDVNSGRATKEGSIEETALKTNLEAAEEVARQLRLRDLAGLIVIDFIDMVERKNNTAVEKRLKDKLKSDRARIQIGRISGFGLMEMSRQRLRPGMLESTTQPCPHCHGTGLIRSDDSLSLTILRAIEEEGTRKRSREVLVKAPIAVVNFLINSKREHIAGIEARYGMSVRVECDPALVSPDYSIEKFKTATRNVPETSSAALSVDANLMASIDDEDVTEDVVETPEETTEPQQDAAPANDDSNGEGGRGRRRRRRRRSKSGDGADEGDQDNSQQFEESSPQAETVKEAPASDAENAEAKPVADDAEEAKPARASRGRSRGRKKPVKEQESNEPANAPVAASAALPEVVDLRDQPDGAGRAEELPGTNEVHKDRNSRKRPAKPAAEAELVEETPQTETAEETPQTETVAEAVEPAEPAVQEQAAEPEAQSPEKQEEPTRPKRRGWWSFG